MIRKSIAKKVLSTLENTLKNNRDEYIKFYTEFGKILKEGVHYDMERKEDIGALLLFESTTTKDGEYTTLNEYISRMKDDQTNIHYVIGQSRVQLLDSPYIEELQSSGQEVLFATDDIDDMILRTLGSFKGKSLISASDASPNAPSESNTEGSDDDSSSENDDSQKLSEEDTKFIDFLKEALSDAVSDVTPSKRLQSYPSLLVNSGFSPDPHMQRILESMGQPYTPPKKGMEINMTHPFVEKLQSMHTDSNNDADLQTIKDYSQLLYDNAVISDGGVLENPGSYVKRITELLTKSL